MKLGIRFTLPDADFNQAYADEYHGGKESENNHRIRWDYGIELNEDVLAFDIVKNDSYRFHGELPNGEVVDVTIPNLRLVRCRFVDGSERVVAGASEMLLDAEPSRGKRKHTTVVHFVFNQMPHVAGREDLYVCTEDLLALKNLPEALHQYTRQVHEEMNED